tara:strand:- start:69200 stop:69904 length:705 start_codon:yes stop_codon:yes gene_type:complete
MGFLGIIFDFDGVIADTEPLHLKAYQEVLAGTAMNLDSKSYFKHYLGYDDVGVFSNVAKDQDHSLNDSELRKLIDEKSKVFQTLVKQNNVLFPYADSCIRELAETVPLGIASGALHEEIELILETYGLRRYFGAIVAADDVHKSKPAPDTYIKTVQLLNRNHSSRNSGSYVAIEDSLWGIDAAHSAGLKCIAITNSYPASVLVSADLVIDKLSEVTIQVLEHIIKNIPRVDAAD